MSSNLGFEMPTNIPRLEGSSAVIVESAVEAEKLLKSFLEAKLSEKDFLLHISANIYHSTPVQRVLSSSGKIHHSWDPERNVLKVKGMSHLQGACQEVICTAIDRAKQNVLSGDESHCLTVYPMIEELSKIICTHSRTKLQIWDKRANTRIQFRCRQTLDQRLARVVFEVGYSETYEDLLSDARRWLLSDLFPSKQRVKLVIIVKIDEDVNWLESHQKTEEFKSRKQELIRQYGDQADFIDGITSIKSKINASDWVGPISVYLESWEMEPNGGITQRWPRISVLPGENAPNPTIKVTDLIPEESRSLFDDFDESRVIELDMDCFRHLLVAEKSEDAFRRAMTVIRPQTTNFGFFPELTLDLSAYAVDTASLAST